MTVEHLAKAFAKRMIEQEARALLTRVAQLKPYALKMPMVMAATIPLAAQTAIEKHLDWARQDLTGMVNRFLHWLNGARGKQATPEGAQKRFTTLRLRFNALISQFDIFADVISQRSEYETGVWIAGLDDLAADAIRLRGNYYQAPPLICYLDRGHGAAIRRARTRLPGGDENPVAVIQVPRERMVGCGIASSLVHEVGHQAAALLDLVNSLKRALQDRPRPLEQQFAWQLWERWLSEIVADFWSVAKVGIAAPLGLIGVVSLPRAFVFRMDMEDPHPFPWIRVKLSCAMGNALYPHPQWARVAGMWESFYPPGDLDDERHAVLQALEKSLPDFVELLVHHQPAALKGKSLKDAMNVAERRPERLAAWHQAWGNSPARMRGAPPTLVFAVISQARADGKITPEDESRILSELLTFWAARSALLASSQCAGQSPARVFSQPTALTYRQGGNHG
jgi:hypothetical protein